MSQSRLVPELYCSDFARSLGFYTDVLGFRVVYARPEERFAFLERQGAELMIEQTVEAERTFVAAPLEYPFGRGMNLQIAATDAEALYKAVVAAGARVFLPLEERWYRTGEAQEEGNRQFVVIDPDGYLLRFAQDLGSRPVSKWTDD